MGAEKILQQFSKIKSAFTSKSKDIVKQEENKSSNKKKKEMMMKNYNI